MDYKLFINFVFLSEVVLLAGFAEATPIPPTEQIEDTVGGVPSTYDSQMFEELRNDESVCEKNSLISLITCLTPGLMSMNQQIVKKGPSRGALLIPLPSYFYYLEFLYSTNLYQL